MQLVDEGKLDLDAPVRTYLPEFKIGDEAAAAQITTRQLLSHTAGFEGDIFTDTGLGDDCVEKYLGVIHEVPQLFPPGEQFSYNNAGFCVLGRLVEVLREKPYDECLRDHLFAPLGLTHAATEPVRGDPVPRRRRPHRARAGHRLPARPDLGARPLERAGRLDARDAPARPARRSPQMHMDDGKAADGTQVLAPGTAAAMHDRAGRPARPRPDGHSWGLGFELFDTADGAIIGHDGSTIGQTPFLRIVPEAGVAVALLTNGGDIISLYQDLVGHVLDELADIHAARRSRCRRPTPERDRREPVRRHLLRRGLRPHRQPGRRRPDLARADPEGHLRGARREARAQGARPLPRRQPDPRRARPRHAHAARLPRRRRRGPRPLPALRPRRPARRTPDPLPHHNPTNRTAHEADTATALGHLRHRRTPRRVAAAQRRRLRAPTGTG